MIAQSSGHNVVDRVRSKPPKCYFDSERDVVDWVLSATPVEDVKKFKEYAKDNGKHSKAIHKSLDCSIMDSLTILPMAYMILRM